MAGLDADLDLQQVADRLKAAMPVLRQVGVLADLDAALQGTFTPPAAFVMPVSERCETPTRTGVLRQRVTLRTGVLLSVQNLRDAKGAAALGTLRPLRTALRTALVGWVPDAATGEPVVHATGRLWRMEGGRIWWLDEFDYVLWRTA
jgi:hypothetical protein